MSPRTFVLCIYAALALVGCMQDAAEPLTAEDRCVLLCEGNDGNHPCKDETAADDCVSTCTTHITPLVGDCLTCVLTQSGWIGQACVCQEVDTFGNLNVTCDACNYTTHQTKCADSTACTRDTEMCEGFTLVAPTDTVCAPACG